jgi:hypothetical protein
MRMTTVIKGLGPDPHRRHQVQRGRRALAGRWQHPPARRPPFKPAPRWLLVPPFARIDHVLTGTRLAVTQIDAKPGFGTDHRYLFAEVAIRT